MLNLASAIAQFIYGFFNNQVCKFIGMKLAMILAMFISGVIYMLFFWIRNRYVYLILNIPAGITAIIASSIPPAIITLNSTPEQIGQNLALLNCFTVVGQQISNFGIGMGLRQIKDTPDFLIGISCVFAYIVGIISFFLVIPKPNENVSAIEDEDENSQSDSTEPASL